MINLKLHFLVSVLLEMIDRVTEFQNFPFLVLKNGLAF